MSDSHREGVFQISHEARLLDFQGDKLCCIVDGDAGSRGVCEKFVAGGFDYNLKGIILRRHDGHQMGCRFIVKDDSHVLDYKCAPSNGWISELRRSARIGIADPAGVVMMVCDDLWTGDIEDVLKTFYQPDQGQ